MPTALITGSGGLVGSEAAEYFAAQGLSILGIDNDLRSTFFGSEGSNLANIRRLNDRFSNYRHFETDIRNFEGLGSIFREWNSYIRLIIHAAAQPSHDWSARNPQMDFSINAGGTMNLLELFRRHCPDAVFIFLSTNKVYGDRVNALPFVEHKDRWELPPDHPQYSGIDERMPVDQSLHSVFGASKLAADMMVQEYGRYFDLKTGCFRCGCLTGKRHAGTQAHGFLSYLM